MLIVLRPGVLLRVLAATAFVSGLVVVRLGPASGSAGYPGAPAPPSGGSDLLTRTTPMPYVVTGTSGHGLNVRSCAASTCRRAGWVGEGGTFLAECWTRGTAAAGDDRWLRGTGGGQTGYAAGHFLRGSGAPECGTSPARPT